MKNLEKVLVFGMMGLAKAADIYVPSGYSTI